MVTKLIACMAMFVVSCSVTNATTLSFDEVPSGTILHGSSYEISNRVIFSDLFRATDHTSFAWGPPHSGSNVLTSLIEPDINPHISFGKGGWSGPADFDHLQSLGAYFSTDVGAMVRITAYHLNDPIPVVDGVVIGAAGESWNNRYVEISTTPDLPFEILVFEGVNSPDDLLGFCLDDMTITLVPEPSSLLALAGGLAGLGGLALRRRRK